MPKEIPPLEENELIENRIDLSEFPNQRYWQVPELIQPKHLIEYNSKMIREDYSFLMNRLSRLPCPVIAANSKIYENTSLGNTCYINGEVSESIMHGYSDVQCPRGLSKSYIGLGVDLKKETKTVPKD